MYDLFIYDAAKQITLANGWRGGACTLWGNFQSVKFRSTDGLGGDYVAIYDPCFLITVLLKLQTMEEVDIWIKGYRYI